MELIEQYTGVAMRQRSTAVERRILEGSNRVVVDDTFAGMVLGRAIYEVPRWRDMPIKRLKIALARRRFQRSGAVS